MSNQLSQIKWVRVILTALTVYIVSSLAIFIVVTGYAFTLAFQARGAPDQTLINAFANQSASWVGPICLIVFTLLGAMHMARRVDTAIRSNGIALGIFASIVYLLFIGIRTFDLGVLLTVVLTIGAGWFGSKLVRK